MASASSSRKASSLAEDEASAICSTRRGSQQIWRRRSNWVSVAMRWEFSDAPSAARELSCSSDLR